MAVVTVIKPPPVSPPPVTYELLLSASEAQHLRNLLATVRGTGFGSNASASLIGLRDELSRAGLKFQHGSTVDSVTIKAVGE